MRVALVGDEPPPPAPVLREDLPLPGPPPPQLPPAGTPPSRGQVNVVHCDIKEEANIKEVAADLRNLAASVIIASCSSTQQAELLGAMLSESSFGSPTRGDGGKGRSSKDEYQERFRWIRHKNMLVAGRDGLVKEVNNKGEWETPRNGSMFIAEVDFCVCIRGIMNMRVAAITDDSTVVERDRQDKTAWNTLGDELILKTVRVLVY